jgi:hypothetical protein
MRTDTPLNIPYFRSIQYIWQKNNQVLSGQKWIDLQDLFLSHLRTQFDHQSRRHHQADLTYMFLAEESVAMYHRKEEFISCVFGGVVNACDYFTWTEDKSRLQASIKVEDFKLLCAAVLIQPSSAGDTSLYTKEETFTLKRVKRSTPNTGSILDQFSSTGSATSSIDDEGVVKGGTNNTKKKLEVKREGIIDSFIGSSKVVKRGGGKRAKLLKTEFRLHLIDYIHTCRIPNLISLQVIDEIIGRLYPDMKNPSDETYYYNISILNQP